MPDSSIDRYFIINYKTVKTHWHAIVIFVEMISAYITSHLDCSSYACLEIPSQVKLVLGIIKEALHHNLICIAQSWRLFINVLCLYKKQISMLRFIALQGLRAHENVEHSERRENVIYRDRSRVVELYYNWKTNNKSCKIMWRLNTSIYW